jgi:hypothetical protein
MNLIRHRRVSSTPSSVAPYLSVPRYVTTLSNSGINDFYEEFGIDVLYQNLCGGTEKNNENPQSGRLMSPSTYEPRITNTAIPHGYFART